MCTDCTTVQACGCGAMVYQSPSSTALRVFQNKWMDAVFTRALLAAAVPFSLQTNPAEKSHYGVRNPVSNKQLFPSSKFLCRSLQSPCVQCYLPFLLYSTVHSSWASGCVARLESSLGMPRRNSKMKPDQTRPDQSHIAIQKKIEVKIAIVSGVGGGLLSLWAKAQLVNKQRTANSDERPGWISSPLCLCRLASFLSFFLLSFFFLSLFLTSAQLPSSLLTGPSCRSD